jgi:putative exosortase-associated protein (TIGR04073 family)
MIPGAWVMRAKFNEEVSMYQRVRAMSLVTLFAAMFVVATPAIASDYTNQVVDKFSRGFANTVTGWVELPKNIVNTSEQSNVGMGLTVGLAKGIMHTVGRTVVGAVELATFFIPSPEYVHPRYVWQPFNKETTYGTK